MLHWFRICRCNSSTVNRRRLRIYYYEMLSTIATAAVTRTSRTLSFMNFHPSFLRAVDGNNATEACLPNILHYRYCSVLFWLCVANSVLL